MTSDERKAWLAQLKVGDEVVIQGYYGRALRKVVKITPTQFVVGNSRFRRSNGLECGDKGYGRHHLVAPTDELREEMIESLDRNTLSVSLDWWRTKVRDAPIATVRKLLAVLAEAEQEQQQGKENQ